MIDLSDYSNSMIEVKSSKGNQPKWFVDNVFYKQDYLGYEGLSEYLISNLLKKSNLKDYEFVEYDIDEIKSHIRVRNGCYSNNFLKERETLITLNRLYKNRYNKNLSVDVFKFEDCKDRARYLVNKIEELTNLKNFGAYMTKIIEIDAFFLNEDRHFNNIAVIAKNSNEYAFCPIFDNGASLLSDTFMDYPIGNDIFQMIDKAKSKTIAWNFYDQLEAFESLYHQQIKFYFTKKDISELLDKATIYSNQEKNRVKDILFEQMRKYRYLFS